MLFWIWSSPTDRHFYYGFTLYKVACVLHRHTHACMYLYVYTCTHRIAPECIFKQYSSIYSCILQWVIENKWQDWLGLVPDNCRFFTLHLTSSKMYTHTHTHTHTHFPGHSGQCWGIDQETWGLWKITGGSGGEGKRCGPLCPEVDGSWTLWHCCHCQQKRWSATEVCLIIVIIVMQFFLV